MGSMASRTRQLSVLVGILVTSVCVGVAEAAVRLLEGGRSSHQIVLESDASPSERTASEELQAHFEACTGVLMPIREGPPPDGGAMIVLGCGPVAQGLGVDPTPEALATLLDTGRRSNCARENNNGPNYPSKAITACKLEKPLKALDKPLTHLYV